MLINVRLLSDPKRSYQMTTAMEANMNTMEKIENVTEAVLYMLPESIRSKQELEFGILIFRS